MLINETLYRTYVNAQKNNWDSPALFAQDGE